MNILADIAAFPRLIQGGMGARISSFKLARATAAAGALGVISSIGLRHIVVEEVRSGNAEAIDAARTFPAPRYVDDLMAYAPGGRRHSHPVPLDTTDPQNCALPRRLSTICSYVEVMRAKMGHCGLVGCNVMWKCALTALPSIYGAMLAGVDALLCGAGVPMELPDIVNRIRAGKDLEYAPLHGTDTHVGMSIEEDATASLLQSFSLPRMIPILSNYAFPKRILDIWNRAYEGAKPFAFVLENHRAGGHNAPPRNKESFGDQDDIDAYFDRVLELGIPVFVAGAGGHREDFQRWVARGAHGLQVGSRFALCEESGLRSDLKERIIALNAAGQSEVLTGNSVSPTGYPFKYVPLAGTLSDPDVYARRKRACNKRYLVHSHYATKADGTQTEDYICPAMPEAQFAKLGGDTQETSGRVCLCNALLATAGLNGDAEPPMVTLGEEGAHIDRSWSAREIVDDILAPPYNAAV